MTHKPASSNLDNDFQDNRPNYCAPSSLSYLSDSYDSNLAKAIDRSLGVKLKNRMNYSKNNYSSVLSPPEAIKVSLVRAEAYAAGWRSIDRQRFRKGCQGSIWLVAQTSL